MSKYYGDFLPGQTVRIPINSGDAAGPATLSGSPAAAVYKDGGTTEVTTGVSVSVDFDGKTGLNFVVVDLSSDESVYTPGSDYTVILTAGTVGGISVVGEVAGSFSVQNRASSGAFARGKVSASPSPTTTTFRATGANLIASDGAYVTSGRINRILWDQGTANSGQWFEVTGHDYAAGDHDFTVTPAMNSAPAAGDRFQVA